MRVNWRRKFEFQEKRLEEMKKELALTRDQLAEAEEEARRAVWDKKGAFKDVDEVRKALMSWKTEWQKASARAGRWENRFDALLVLGSKLGGVEKGVLDGD